LLCQPTDEQQYLVDTHQLFTFPDNVTRRGPRPSPRANSVPRKPDFEAASSWRGCLDSSGVISYRSGQELLKSSDRGVYGHRNPYSIPCMDAEMRKIRVIIGDKRELFREGLKKIINEQPNMEVVFTAPKIRECMERAGDLKPDICIIDTFFSEPECLMFAQKLCHRYPNVKVIVLTHSEEDKDLFTALRLGARAYLSKFITTEQLRQAIEQVNAGEVIVSPPMAAKLLEEFTQREGAKEETVQKTETNLSPRETEVLALLSKGKTNKELSQELFISENTVKVHLRNIMEKLNVRNRSQVIALALEKGLNKP
jgi:DNA-binding NarL/FixJ family response regulator